MRDFAVSARFHRLPLSPSPPGIFELGYYAGYRRRLRLWGGRDPKLEEEFFVIDMPKPIPLPLDQGGRRHHESQRSLDIDDAGNEILVGLTRPESEDYLRLAMEGFKLGSSDKIRYQELHAKHEAAKSRRLAGVVELRYQRSKGEPN